MTGLSRVTGDELARALGRMGFELKRIRGSHHFLEHPDGRTTVVPVHPGETIELVPPVLVHLGVMRSHCWRQSRDSLERQHHKSESEIVRDAGQPGAVTIVTNMAGRGTDGVHSFRQLELVGLTDPARCQFRPESA